MAEQNENNAPAKERTGFRATRRDVELLKLLQEYGCVDADRIRAKLWNDHDPCRGLFRRIGILKRLKLIENVIGDNRVTLGYRITRVGQNFLERRGQKVDSLYARKQYRTEFEHDQLLIDARRILETSLVVSDFKTDQQMRIELLSPLRPPIDWSKAPTVPDGAFVYQGASQRLRIALELELSLKSEARYFRIFRSHLLSTNWQIVFYIVRDETMKAKLVQILDKAKANDEVVRSAKRLNGVYLCTLPEFQEKKLGAQFTNGKSSISLAELESQAKKNAP